jgi:hypothetical protein
MRAARALAPNDPRLNERRYLVAVMLARFTSAGIAAIL